MVGSVDDRSRRIVAVVGVKEVVDEEEGWAGGLVKIEAEEW